ncbi:MAG TPA: GNAT family N-acetyltransferase [Edaphobacter sp.]|nr:GNAT family N-acetyltransferase [Edaphobacter sp.]
MSNFVIHAGVPDDLEKILALEKSVAEAPHWTEPIYAEIIIKGENNSYARRCLFVAHREDTLIGFAVGKSVAETAELESVVVAAFARRCGAGKKLCEAIVNWSRNQQAASVELEVRAANKPALALYRMLGFIEVGRRPRYYSHPVDDAILMRLDL